MKLSDLLTPLPDYNASLSLASVAQAANTHHVMEAEFWRKICPELTIATSNKHSNTPVVNVINESSLSRIVADGYCQAKDLTSSVLAGKLSRSALRLVKYGWPSSFFGMYDECYAIYHQVSTFIKESFHTELEPNLDILTFFVHPNLPKATDDLNDHQRSLLHLITTSGFSPHRDRQPDDAMSSFFTNKVPKYITCWIALTEASPDNSCLYVIPASVDPGYYAGDSVEHDAPGPVHAALSTKESFRNVHALPLPAGGANFFSHRIIHWGSQGYAAYDGEPRIALSFAVSSPDFERCYLQDGLTALQSSPNNTHISLRLSLISAQMLIYYDRFDFTSSMIKFFHSAFSGMIQHFETVYKKKVLTEFVNAIKRQNAYDKNEDVGDDGSEDDLDLALEAALDAEEDGDEVLFEDAYDMMQSDKEGDYVDDGDDDDEEDDEAEGKDLFPTKKRRC